MKAVFATTLLTAVALTGCNPGAINDGLGKVSLNITGDNSTAVARTMARTLTDTSLPVTGVNGTEIGTITIDKAWVIIDEIKFENEDDYADGETEDNANEEIEFTGPFAVDLMTGTSYPSIPAIEIDTGVYTDIEFKLEPLETEQVDGLVDLPAAMTTELPGYAVVISGNYVDAAQSVNLPFSMTLDNEVELELSGAQASQGFVIDDAGLNDIIIAFRMNQWFDFSNTETNSNSVSFANAFSGASSITLSSDSATEIFEVVRDNIENSTEYGEDEDGNGELDEDEDDDIEDDS